ncbi:FGGY-family carbohydrate kinase [Caldilinea sp.]|uniref:FGGY-family carbohydrate kinase n=1 Tax=Caldilinea sp. TaxID=2293560 RepID=UPI0026371D52|nr:FGGY-family carbohydrate kinase [uncultured Caldilinea sp.]
MVLLGIDIGTTATKVIAIDAEGRLLAETERPSALRSPQPGWAEEDAEEWWTNVCAAVPACLRSAQVNAEEVAAVGVSGMTPALVLLDAQGRVVRPSIQQNDARAVKEIEEFRSRTEEKDILQRTGSAITQQSIGPKLLWLRRHEPETMAQAVRVMGSYDFIAHRLTGAFSIERNWALESGLFDLHTEDWDDELLALSTISRTWLAAPRWPAEIVGEVTKDAADDTGLKAGTPVVAGSADHVASAFSAGLKAGGDLLVKLGGAGDILYCVSEPIIDARLFLDYHVIPGLYLVNGCMAASGSIIKWFRNAFAPETDYAALDAEAAALPPGAEGLVLLPYFLGEKTPLHDPLARGTVVGLTLSHTRAHLFRAILEGIGYGFCHHLEVLAERGLRATRARVTNGGARSMLWKQITADVLGLPLEQIARHPGSSLGAAFVAGMGVGAFRRWEEIERYIQIEGVVEPNLTNHARYREFFHLYRAIYEALKDVYPRLAGLAS